MSDNAWVLVRLGEVWLKGRNRNKIVGRLLSSLHAALRLLNVPLTIRQGQGRLYLELTDPAHIRHALAVCADTPGIHSASAVIRTDLDLDVIEKEALAWIADAWAGATGSFAVQTKRANKHFPHTSPAIGRRIGSAIAIQTGLTVNLSSPDRVFGIEIDAEHAWLWLEKVPCPGGMPIGMAGSALLLLSGGIDSPVAGYMAQRRGCRIDAIYFHAPPYVGEGALDKVTALAKKLAPRQGGLRLHVIHFTEIQLAIRDNCNPKLTVLLYRRFMYRIAHQLADILKIDALCTGENLSQVASQTLTNLSAVDAIGDRIVLRPLITYDKQDTTAVARRIGTFDISSLPHDDCCTLFIPKHPATRSTDLILTRAERALPVDELVQKAIESRTLTEV